MDEDYWEDRAECKQSPIEVFFPEIVGDVTDRPYRQAKTFCNACSVREQCLDLAMTVEKNAPYRFGVFGGLTPKERNALSGSYRYE